jgi:rhamnose utilization protein RhaD (predicted bifunctional aldolase and dehydrogenase)
MAEFNQEYGHKLAWLPWQRPGFELGMMLRRIVQQTPGCDGVVLGGHGLFTWGETQRESYLNTITIIDQLGQFIERHGQRAGHRHFSGAKTQTHEDRERIATEVMPYLRGAVDRHVYRQAGGAGFCELSQRGKACASRDELPRPLYPHQDPANVFEVGSGGQCERNSGTN